MSPRAKFEHVRGMTPEDVEFILRRAMNLDDRMRPDERLAYQSQARALQEFALETAAEELRTAVAEASKYKGRNAGQQAKTIERIKFLRAVALRIGSNKPQAVAHAALQDEATKGFFDSYEKLYNFLVRHRVLYGIRKPQKPAISITSKVP